MTGRTKKNRKTNRKRSEKNEKAKNGFFLKSKNDKVEFTSSLLNILWDT